MTDQEQSHCMEAASNNDVRKDSRWEWRWRSHQNRILSESDWVIAKARHGVPKFLNPTPQFPRWISAAAHETGRRRSRYSNTSILSAYDSSICVITIAGHAVQSSPRCKAKTATKGKGTAALSTLALRLSWNISVPPHHLITRNSLCASKFAIGLQAECGEMPPHEPRMVL